MRAQLRASRAALSSRDRDPALHAAVLSEAPVRGGLGPQKMDNKDRGEPQRLKEEAATLREEVATLRSKVVELSQGHIEAEALTAKVRPARPRSILELALEP